MAFFSSQESFGSQSRFWSEHGYNSETGTPGYFSYIHSLDSLPETNIEQASLVGYCLPATWSFITALLMDTLMSCKLCYKCISLYATCGSVLPSVGYGRGAFLETQELGPLLAIIPLPLTCELSVLVRYFFV